MVHTTTRSPADSHGALTGFGLAAAFAVSAAGLVIATSSPAAAADTSTAYGVSASGVDSKSPQPTVSSDGAVKSSSGSVSGMGWSATGITVKAGNGIAEATVAAVTVAGRAIGSVSATCRDGVTTYAHGGSPASDERLKIRFGGGAGAVIEILGAGGKPSQTITVAVAKCGKSTTPPTSPPTSTPPGPTGTPPPGGGTPTSSTGKPPTQKPTQTQQRPRVPAAPAPTPKPGHVAVTG